MALVQELRRAVPRGPSPELYESGCGTKHPSHRFLTLPQMRRLSTMKVLSPRLIFMEHPNRPG